MAHILKSTLYGPLAYHLYQGADFSECAAGPLLNKGTVIKTNNNQRYATSATTGFVIRELSRQAYIHSEKYPVSCVYLVPVLAR